MRARRTTGDGGNDPTGLGVDAAGNVEGPSADNTVEGYTVFFYCGGILVQTEYWRPGDLLTMKGLAIGSGEWVVFAEILYR